MFANGRTTTVSKRWRPSPTARRGHRRGGGDKGYHSNRVLVDLSLDLRTLGVEGAEVRFVTRNRLRMKKTWGRAERQAHGQRNDPAKVDSSGTHSRCLLQAEEVLQLGEDRAVRSLQFFSKQELVPNHFNLIALSVVIVVTEIEDRPSVNAIGR